MLFDDLRIVLAVAAGSALGGTARYLVGLIGPDTVFPWSTLAINASGCLLIGIAAGLAARGSGVLAGIRLYFVVMGICGGYTTVSLFGLETLMLLRLGQPYTAAAYVFASILLCQSAVAVGTRLAGR